MFYSQVSNAQYLDIMKTLCPDGYMSLCDEVGVEERELVVSHTFHYCELVLIWTLVRSLVTSARVMVNSLSVSPTVMGQIGSEIHQVNGM